MNLFESDSYYVFGAGSIAKMCKKILEKNNKKIVNFLTSKRALTEIKNILVINLSENDLWFDRSIPVIIGVFNREENANMSHIVEYLKRLKFETIISFYDFFDQFSREIGNLYWLTNKTYYSENLSNYQLVRDLFTEPKSLDIFDRLTKFQQSFDYTLLPLPELTNQYFPNDINVWDGQNAFLDIGSYDGQTIIDAYQKYGKLDMAIAYEPDPLNIVLINKKIKHINPSHQFFLIPCGVWSKNEILKFSSGGGESSSVKNEGDISIQALTLDDTLFGVIPGYIKMDIEGAEIEALEGAEETIKQYSPSLAISLYHCPNHIFEIPLFIKSWGLDYNYFIRSHGNNLLETVLYCTPNKK